MDEITLIIPVSLTGVIESNQCIIVDDPMVLVRKKVARVIMDHDASLLGISPTVGHPRANDIFANTFRCNSIGQIQREADSGIIEARDTINVGRRTQMYFAWLAWVLVVGSLEMGIVKPSVIVLIKHNRGGQWKSLSSVYFLLL